MKKILFVFAAAMMMAISCTSIPATEEEENIGDGTRTTIPYRLTIIETKVSYEGGTYALAEGDKLRVTGRDRDDIEGILEKDSAKNEWNGTLTYTTDLGAPNGTTAMVATLIHAANDDYTTYANAVVSSTVTNQMQYAVEHYGWFTADYTYGEESIVLSQKAAFLDVNVFFDFDGTHQMGDTGVAEVDIVTSRGHASGQTILTVRENGEDYDSQVLVVVPGGDNVQDIDLTLSDREITFQNSAVLEPNKKYTVNRTVVYRPLLGDPFWSDGTYGRFPHEDGVDIVGIIVYVNRHSSDPDSLAMDEAITEKNNGGGHALVMALHNATATGQKWSTSNSGPYNPIVPSAQDVLLINSISGVANTSTLAGHEECNAAILAKSYENGTNYSGNTTGWFLPSIGQWLYAICAYGEVDPVEAWTDNSGNNWLKKGNDNSLIRVKRQDSNSENENLLVKKLNDRLDLLRVQYGITYDSFGILVLDNGVYKNSDNYWSSSERSDSQAIRMNLGSVEAGTPGPYYSTIKVKPEDKTSTYSWKQACIMKVRPFLAF
ncbi:MAG: hypothetical protein J5693_06295 [Bacteroidales bacterium]|nr:hypothetical protein [Bacteroidales bacterium]